MGGRIGNRGAILPRRVMLTAEGVRELQSGLYIRHPTTGVDGTGFGRPALHAGEGFRSREGGRDYHRGGIATRDFHTILQVVHSVYGHSRSLHGFVHFILHRGSVFSWASLHGAVLHGQTVHFKRVPDKLHPTGSRAPLGVRTPCFIDFSADNTDHWSERQDL